VINPSLLTTTAIVTGLVVTLGLGVMPSPLLDLAQSTATFLR
jgi:NADH-quinone oxidoreductase subunit N